MESAIPQDDYDDSVYVSYITNSEISTDDLACWTAFRTNSYRLPTDFNE